MGTSRGIPSPWIACHLNLASLTVAQELARRLGGQHKMPCFSFPNTVTVAKPQDSEMPYCVSRVQAGQDVIDFGTKCEINV